MVLLLVIPLARLSMTVSNCTLDRRPQPRGYKSTALPLDPDWAPNSQPYYIYLNLAYFCLLPYPPKEESLPEHVKSSLRRELGTHLNLISPFKSFMIYKYVGIYKHR